jgi:hypothetical protein
LYGLECERQRKKGQVESGSTRRTLRRQKYDVLARK